METQEKFRIECPHCHSGIKVKYEHVGRRAKCPHCKGELLISDPDEVELIDTFIPAPKKEINLKTKFCHHCGEKIASEAEICPKCGVRQGRFKESAKPQSDNRRITAALLALFLGTLGAHWFYLGQKNKAIIYLLCIFPGFILIIPALISCALSIYDGVTFLSMSDSKFEKTYPAEIE